MHPRLAVLASAAAVATAGCAYMQSYTNSRVLKRPPYYDTYGGFVSPGSSGVGHLGVGVDAAEVPDQRERAVLAPLQEAMNGYLDTAGWSVKLDAAPPPAGAPWAYVGSARGLHARSNLPADTATGPVMVMRALGPSRRWADGLRQISARRQVSVVLAINLGWSEYYVRQRGALSPRKELDLGSGYRVDVGWFTDLDRPVRVLQLTGLLLGTDGKVLRSGAEGIAVQHSSLVERAVGAESEIGESDVTTILTTLRRDDLEGHPLVWQVALRNLVGNLLGAP